MTELKPCPFCGKAITGNQPYYETFDTDDDYYVIRCAYCSAMIFREDRTETIEAWNRRMGGN